MRRQIQTGLFGKQIQTAIVNISSIAAPEEGFRYREKRPLFVLPTESEALRLDLEQLPSKFPLTGSRWLLFLDDKTAAEDFLRGVNIPFDCEFLVVQRSSEVFVVITEVYRVQGPLQTNYWGNWSHRDGLKEPTKSFYNRRSDLQGAIIKAATGHNPPTDILIETGDKLEISGYSADLWNYLERAINFTTQFVKSRDNIWGSVNDDGSWSGMIGMIVNGDVDAAVNSFMMTAARVEVVDFVMPTAASRVCVFIRTPDSSPSWNRFLTPLSTSLWLVFLATIIFKSCVLTAVRRLGGHKGGLVDSLFRIWGTFCIQGQSVIPEVSSCRLIFWVTNITAIIMMGAYSANFIANLTVRQIHLPFTDLQGLLKEKSYEFEILADSGLRTIFQSGVHETDRDPEQSVPHEVALQPVGQGREIISEEYSSGGRDGSVRRPGCRSDCSRSRAAGRDVEKAPHSAPCTCLALESTQDNNGLSI